MVRSAQTVHVSWIKISTIPNTDRNELAFEPCHLGVPSGVSITISKAMVHLAQTMHLSCTETNTISKRTERRFYMTHVTKQFHWVCPKLFLSQQYVRRKPCTYLESRLALSPNGPKRASIWGSSRRSTIRCVQNDFWTYGTFDANRAPNMHQN
jgi:hypothetical protein